MTPSLFRFKNSSYSENIYIYGGMAMYHNADKEAMELYFELMRWEALKNKQIMRCRKCCKYRR